MVRSSARSRQLQPHTNAILIATTWCAPYACGMAKKRTKKYGPTAAKKVAKVMREFKRGKLKSGQSDKKVTSKKQAIAIGLSEARKIGAKVPKKPASKRKKRA
jgi:hypothetical protein